MEVLKGITPINIKKKTDACESLQISFLEMWSRHGADAARLSLLPHVYNGKVVVLE